MLSHFSLTILYQTRRRSANNRTVTIYYSSVKFHRNAEGVPSAAQGVSPQTKRPRSPADREVSPYAFLSHGCPRAFSAAFILLRCTHTQRKPLKFQSRTEYGSSCKADNARNKRRFPESSSSWHRPSGPEADEKAGPAMSRSLSNLLVG